MTETIRLKTVLEEKDEILDELLENFPFEKIREYMKEKNWTWVGDLGGKLPLLPAVPSIAEMKSTVSTCFHMAATEWDGRSKEYVARSSTGGFEVWIAWGMAELKFVIAERVALAKP